jgi:hypothetical protein
MHQQKINLHFQIKSLRFQQNQDQRQTLAFLEGDPSDFCQLTCNVTLALPEEVELSQFFLHIFFRFCTFSLYFYALCIIFFRLLHNTSNCFNFTFKMPKPRIYSEPVLFLSALKLKYFAGTRNSHFTETLKKAV